MRTDKFDQSTFLVLKAAYLYYISQKSQSQIAKELGISITTVSRLLKKAKEERIIEFVIRDPLVQCIEMEQKLEQVLGIKEVVIAPALRLEDGMNMDIDPDNVKKLVALEEEKA